MNDGVVCGCLAAVCFIAIKNYSGRQRYWFAVIDN